MKVFHCDSCGNLVFFENVKCLSCGHTLGFLPFPTGNVSALEPAGDTRWKALAADATCPTYRQCGNSIEYQICNWMIPADDPNALCHSCRLNDMIPNLSTAGNTDRWHKIENAKRRALYSVMRLGLSVEGVPQENRPGLRFKIIEDIPGGPPLLTGHLDGLITINIAEADDAERERRRVNLHEPYRTLLGHFRHEIAHYFWDRLIANSRWLPDFRKIFGDESLDYSEAIKGHYQLGPPPDWQARHVSAYASAHPWEDWAEAWAHYFHIIDMVETAQSFGISVNLSRSATAIFSPTDGVMSDVDFQTILRNWFPLTQALNSLNRSMGLQDIYPFVLSEAAIEKLGFIHEVVRASGNGRR